jgi:hypothetical protein
MVVVVVVDVVVVVVVDVVVDVAVASVAEAPVEVVPHELMAAKIATPTIPAAIRAGRFDFWGSAMTGPVDEFSITTVVRLIR